jgi:hypothetical protein
MAYVAPTTRATGFLVTAAVWNQDVVNNVAFLANPPACRVRRTTDQTGIVTATRTSILFDAERYDTDTMHSTSTNTDRITINTAGLYIVTGTVTFTNTNATGYRLVDIELNGTTIIAEQSVGMRTDNYIVMNVTTMYKFAAADFVKLVVYHTAGVNSSVLAQANFAPEFAATWVGLG